MNQVNRVLDEFESIHGRLRSRERKRELLERAILASSRGIEVLAMDLKTRANWGGERPDWEAVEEMRQDAALLRAFIKAECRLLDDLGVDRSATARIERYLTLVLAKPNRMEDPVVPPLGTLEESLLYLRGQLDDEGNHHEVLTRLSGVLEVLGGGSRTRR